MFQISHFYYEFQNHIEIGCLRIKIPITTNFPAINGLFSDQKGGNKLLSVAKISARQVLCCYQMLLPDGAGVARSLSLR